MINRDCTVLVTSCDGYRDVERPFIELFRRYWPDCPFEIVLLTETAATEGYDRTIATGRGKTWSEMLVEALGQIETPYVLMIMNDFMSASPVDTKLLLRRIDEMKRFDAVNLRLIPIPPGRVERSDTELMEAPKDTAYCISCQTGIWNREFLRDLARKTKSAWEFERYGSFMVGDEHRPIFVSPVAEYPSVDTIHKGYWMPWGVDLLKTNSIAYDFSKRGLPPLGKRIRFATRRLIFKLFPWTLIVRIQNILNVGMKEKPRSQPPVSRA